MECRSSIPRTLGSFALGVLMIAVSYYAATTATGFIEAVGWIGVVCFGLCTLLILSRGHRVCVYHTSPAPAIYLSVAPKRERGPRGCINDGASLSRMSEKIGFSPLSMNFSGLTPGLDEAYARLRDRLPERAVA